MRIAANKLIASLKADVAAQKNLSKESQGLKKKIDTQASDIERLKTEVARLTSSLSESHAENKTLSTKLAANRNAASSVESATSKTPGSAMKANGGIRMMGSAEAAQQVQAGQLKEDLYGDLTGLIIRSANRESEEDVYDCIQTGCNGSKFSDSCSLAMLTVIQHFISSLVVRMKRVLRVLMKHNAFIFHFSILREIGL